MIWVCTIATHGRYLENAEAMRKVLEFRGFGFHLEREMTMPPRKAANGVCSNHAKAAAILNCFRLHGGVDGVYWIDADCEIRAAWKLAEILKPVPADVMAVGVYHWMPEYAGWYYDREQRGWIEEVAAGYGLPFADLKAPPDQLMGFGMRAALGALVRWSNLAFDLERRGIVVGDGVVAALAARGAGLQVVSGWSREGFAQALHHKQFGQYAEVAQ